LQKSLDIRRANHGLHGFNGWFNAHQTDQNGYLSLKIRVFPRDSWAEEKRRVRLRQKATAGQGSAALQNIRVIRAIRG
jgi:hypothetical protein